MDLSSLDLSDLFKGALETVQANRQEVNGLDGYNGNHGDNMVDNIRTIVESLASKGGAPPAEALRHAGEALQSQGRGGTSQYYARGLGDVAERFEGRSSLDEGDVVSMVQSLLGGIPSEGHEERPEPGGSVLDQIIGLGGSQPTQAGGGILDQIMGMVGGQAAQPQAAPQPPAQDDGVDMGDVLEALLPAGLAFLQARQSGADTAGAVGQALMSVLLGGRVNPLQAATPRAAAGGLIAQSILKALAGRR
jgi:hypothetical protein